MRNIGARETIGYFWIIVVLIFVVLVWWKVSGMLYREDICVLQSGFTCIEKTLSKNGQNITLDLVAKNNLGRWVKITGFMCSAEAPDPALGRPNRRFEDMGVNALADSGFRVTGQCHGTKASERSFNGIIYLRYEFMDEPYVPGSRIILGNIRGRIG